MPSLTAGHAAPSGSKTSQKQASEDSSAFESVLASSSQTHVVDKSSNSAQQSASSALGRSLASQMAFMFSRPIRLFRPVKISSLTALQALAQQRGQDLSPTFAKNLVREEGWRLIPRHLLPPLVINSVLGFFLFATFSVVQTGLEYTHLVSAIYIPAVSGGCAGFVQSLVSSPLDNIRLVLQNRSSQSWPGWLGVLRESIFPHFVHPFHHVDQPEERQHAVDNKAKVRQRWRAIRRWGSRGWSNMVLSSTRDVLGFAAFFTIFEAGRAVALRFRSFIDTYASWMPTRLSQTIQAICICLGGTVAGIGFGIISRPFDIARGFIWEARMEWAKRWQEYNMSRTSSADAEAQRAAAQPGAAPSRKLPGALSTLARFVRAEGVTTLIGFPRRPPATPHTAQYKLVNHPALGGSLQSDVGGNDINRNQRRAQTERVQMGWRSLSKGQLVRRVFTIVPPYTLGFLAWAITSGDLSM